MSEWYRFRRLYKRFITPEELTKFDEKLKKRPEFKDGLMAGSLANAIRTNDTEIIELIKTGNYYKGAYFNQIIRENKNELANEICAKGYGPWYFNVNLSDRELVWWLNRPVPVLIKIGAYALQDKCEEIVEKLTRYLPEIIHFIATTSDPRIKIDEINFKPCLIELIQSNRLTLELTNHFLAFNVNHADLIEVALRYKHATLPILEQAGISVSTYFSNQCKNFNTIAHQTTLLKNYVQSYHQHLSSDTLLLLQLKIEKLESLLIVDPSPKNKLLLYFRTSMREDTPEKKLRATKILDATTFDAVNAAVLPEPRRSGFFHFRFK